MALPVINEVPSYKITIPSTKKELKFRPFLVKEQKILLMALESQDVEEMIDAMQNTIKSCCLEDINVESLSTFDSEYIFTKIRAKSVGETTDVGIYCDACEHVNEVTVNLDKVEVNIPDDNLEIKLNDQFVLKMKYPTYRSMGKIISNTDNGSSAAQDIFNTAVASFDKLFTDDEVIDMNEEPEEERIKFLDNLNPDQFKLVTEFAINMPQLVHDVKFTCEKCKKENEQQIQGIQSFFQ